MVGTYYENLTPKATAAANELAAISATLLPAGWLTQFFVIFVIVSLSIFTILFQIVQ